jgi:hypothetical protein
MKSKDLAGSLEGLLKSRRRLEANGLGSIDLHCFSSLGITPHTGSAILNFESSKSDDLDFRVFPYAICNGVKNSSKRILCGAFGCFISEGLLDSFDEFTFIHSSGIIFLYAAL